MNITESTPSLLSYYSALECASHEMLEAARAGDWDSVCRLEGACVVVISRLRQRSDRLALEQELGERPHRLRILQTIVTNDAEIRRIAQPDTEVELTQTWSVVGCSLRMH